MIPINNIIFPLTSTSHFIVVQFQNLGNAFVLLWRIGDEEELLASYGGGGRHMMKRASMSQSMAQLGGIHH